MRKFTLMLNAAKITNYNKKCFKNKSCPELNFLQKSQWAHMFNSPRTGARGLERSPCLKYYYVLELSTFTSVFWNIALLMYFLRQRFFALFFILNRTSWLSEYLFFLNTLYYNSIRISYKIYPKCVMKLRCFLQKLTRLILSRTLSEHVSSCSLWLLTNALI